MTATYVKAQVVITLRGPRVRVTTPEGALIGYYKTAQDVLDDVTVPVEVVEEIADYSQVREPIYARAHHYEVEEGGDLFATPSLPDGTHETEN